MAFANVASVRYGHYHDRLGDIDGATWGVGIGIPFGKFAAGLWWMWWSTATPFEVTRGTEVTWTNQDDIRRTVTSGTPERRDAKFDAELGGKGAATKVTFSKDMADRQMPRVTACVASGRSKWKSPSAVA